MFDHDPTDPHEVGLNADRLAAMPGSMVGVDAGEGVIDEVLQVVGITALSRGAEQDHGWG